MIRLVDKIVWIVSWILVISLAGAYMARYINPNGFILPSLLGLAYPYLFVVNLVLLFYWLLRKKKAILLPLTIGVLGIPTFISYYGINSRAEADTTADLSILSYNVRYFDKYNWSHDPDTYDRLINYINSFDGDIVCLQEYPPEISSDKSKGIISGLSSYPYHYIEKGMAIFSRQPVTAQGNIIFGGNNTAALIYCDIEKGEDTLRIYNTHLESYKLDMADRKFVREVYRGAADNLSKGIKSITARIIKANKNRAEQAIRIKTDIKHSPYKVIVCGDFNDTPLSYTYKTIQRGLTDSFLEKGRGLGNTYIGEFPSFRIDYILHSPELKTVAYLKENTILSDHYPIICRVNIRSIP